MPKNTHRCHRRRNAGFIAALLLSAITLATGLPAAANAGTTGGRDATRCGWKDGAFTHGPRSRQQIALTFDACPTRHIPGFSNTIVDYLESQHIPATFFVSGRWAETHRREFSRLASVPFFEVASHGYRHRHLTDADETADLKDIAQGQQSLVRLHAHPDPMFRPPYGDLPAILPTLSKDDGLTPVLWDVVTGDPDPHVTPAGIEHEVLAHARGGSIVVMHVNGRGVGTPKALPVFVSALRKKGFDFVTVGSLLQECRGHPNAGRLPN
jgi:peptidoglycan/xylan/chitin deacetylase (PgdA/CDA1 family)